MGFDFAAILHYDCANHGIPNALDLIEANLRPRALLDVVRYWKQRGYGMSLDHICAKPTWVLADNHYSQIKARPNLPSYKAHLGTPEGFFFGFGDDAVVVYHLLRWRQFLLDSEWHRVMLHAIDWIREILEVNDCVITNDCHPAILSIRKGVAKYQEALDEANEGENGEVKNLADLYIGPDDNWDTKGYWRLSGTF